MGVGLGRVLSGETLGPGSLTPQDAVDDPLVDAPIPVHGIDGPRSQGERGWLWGQREESPWAGVKAPARPLPSPPSAWNTPPFHTREGPVVCWMTHDTLMDPLVMSHLPKDMGLA